MGVGIPCPETGNTSTQNLPFLTSHDLVWNSLSTFFIFFFFYLELLHPCGNHRPSPCPKDDCFCDPAMLLQLIFPPKPFTTDISSYISVSLYACFLAMLLFEFLAHPMMCFLYMIIYCLVPSELVNMVFLIPLPHMWHVQASPAF